MGQFSDSILRNSQKALQKVNRDCYTIARDLFATIVSLTPSPSNPGPFADGYLVNQWYPAEGGELSEELGPDSDISPTGTGSLSRISRLNGKEFLFKDGVITLANNTHYAYRAEVLGWPQSDGWSGNIGPYRMVARSIQLISARYK